MQIAERWKVAFVAMLVSLAQAGTMYMVPTTVMPLLAMSLNVPMGFAPIPVAVEKVAFVVWLLIVGVLMDRVRPKLCIVSGLLFLAVLAGLYPVVARGLCSVIAVHILIALGGALISTPMLAMILVSWFDETEYPSAIGVVLASFSLSGICLTPIVALIANATSWKVPWTLVSGLLVTLALVVLNALSEPPLSALEEHKHLVDDSGYADDERERAKSGSESRTISFQWRRVIIFSVFSYQYYSAQYCFGVFQDNLFLYLMKKGVGISLASGYFSVFCLFIFVGTILEGRLVERFAPLALLAFGSSLSAVGIVITIVGELVASRGAAMKGIFATTVILHGFGYGFSNSSLYVLVPEYFDTDTQGRVQSIFFAIGILGNASGAALTGALTQQCGSYSVPFSIAFAVACCSAIAAVISNKFFERDTLAELEQQEEKQFLFVDTVENAASTISRRGRSISWMLDSRPLSSYGATPPLQMQPSSAPSGPRLRSAPPSYQQALRSAHSWRH